MKKIWNILFAKDINLKVRIFNLIALIGIAVTLVVLLASIIHGTSFVNCASLLITAVIATALLIHSVKTQRYMQCYLMTIVFVFLFLFPVLFFTAGGYHSGMPCFFVFAFVFTMFMLEGRLGVVFTAIEMVLYFVCCLLAYLYPEMVMEYPNEQGVLVDVVISFLVSGTALGAALSSLIRMYNNQKIVLEEAKYEAESSNLAKSKFLSQMSHEIRTPINAILGMNEMILRGGTEEEIEEYASNIKNAGNTLLSLVNDILDFSKIESEKLQINPVEYELASMLNDLLNLISDRAKKKGLQLQVNVDPNIPCRLSGDCVRIKQIITNLITNSVKYTERGSVTLEIGSTHTNKGTVLLHVSVKDTGIGIKEEDKELLLMPFQRVDLTKNYNIEGSGLGLSITANLLELMNSKLCVESEYGVGSVFSFDIEQGIVDEIPIGDFESRLKEEREKPDTYREGFYAPEGRILVVDDNQMNLSVVKGLLKNTGLKIDTALSGTETLEMVRREYYHIIFLDHMMPGPDGVETYKRIKELSDNKCVDSKFIMLTANAVSGAKEMFLANGFDGFISKPIDPYKLENIIIQYLPKGMVKEHPMQIQPDVSMGNEIVANQKQERTKEETILGNEWISSENLLDVLQKNLPQVDFEKGLANCGGDQDIYLDLLGDFVKLPIREQLNQYLRENDFKNYCVKVHGFKGNAYTIGAVILGDMAYEMERITREELPDEIKILQKHLLEQYDRICFEYNSRVS